MQLLHDFFKSEQLSCYAALSLSDCRIRKPYLLQKHGISPAGSVLLVLAPYFLTPPSDNDMQNISLYAVPRDYHLYFSSLFDSLKHVLSEKFPNAHFQGFADHSPIDEVHAAATAGLGVLGDHHLLIHPVYGSFVFIGGFFSDLPVEVYQEIARKPQPIASCLHCDQCARHCPAQILGREIPQKAFAEQCLSAITQKKGDLSAKESQQVRASGSVWGCDMCQRYCPMNKPQDTPLSFFRQELIFSLDSASLAAMPEDVFARRAYAWRPKSVLERNLALMDSTNPPPKDDSKES